MEEQIPMPERELEMDAVEVQRLRGERITLADLVAHKRLTLAAAEVPAYGRIALEGCLWAKWISNPKAFSEPYLLLYSQAGRGFQAIIRVRENSADGKLTYLISEVCATHPEAVQNLKVKLGLTSSEQPQRKFTNNPQMITRYSNIFANVGQVETEINDVDPVILAHHLLGVHLPPSIPRLSFPGAVTITKTNNPYYLLVWSSSGGQYQGIGINATTDEIVVTEIFTNLQQALECGHATVLQNKIYGVAS